MQYERNCRDCVHPFPLDSGLCPHCGRPSLFPNVDRAEAAAERQALKRRYDQAMNSARQRGCEAQVEAFEQATAASAAVMGRSFAKTLDLASGDRTVVGTYHREIESGLRLPDGNRWDLLRTVADATLFGAYRDEIRFAALALDGQGLEHYGECSWVLREEMVAHRASVFEANSAVFVRQLNESSLAMVEEIPPGHRATWDDRSKLCVAKLASRIDPSTPSGEFSQILLESSDEPGDDEFVEVHVGGPMTIRTLESIRLQETSTYNSLRRHLAAKVTRFDVVLEGGA